MGFSMLMIYLLLFGIAGTSMGIKWVRKYFSDRKREYVLVRGKIIGHQEGRVTDFKREGGDIPLITYTPIFEYFFNGKTYQGKHVFGSARVSKGMGVAPGLQYRKGDEVDLRVYPEEPSQAVINTEGTVRFPLFAGGVVFIIGIIHLGIAVLLYWI